MNAWLKLALRGSLLGTLGALVATGCGDDGKTSVEAGDGGESVGGRGSEGGAPEGGVPDQGGTGALPDAGEPSSGGTAGVGDGGSALGGSDSVGGSGPVAGSDSGAGAGGSAGGEASTSVARFCNGLSGLDAENLTFVLEVGEGSEKVTFTADSFTCAPADGGACLPIPLGIEVPVALYQQGDPVPWFEGTVFSEFEDQWTFFTFLEMVQQDTVPSLDATTTNGTIACDDVTYAYVYPPG
jgi:hypothetical protein